MPIHQYLCPEGHRCEELFLGTQKPHDAVECPYCGLVSQRVLANRFNIGGYSQLELERLEAAHFTKSERRAAHQMRGSMDSQVRHAGQQATFRTAKDVAKYEQAMGIRRLDPHGSEIKERQEDMLDEHRDLKKAMQEGGRDGLHAAIDKMDIQGKTGMSDATYARWSNLSEKVNERVQRGEYADADN